MGWMETEKKTIILIGDSSSKRAVFFRKAAQDLGVRLHMVEWESLREDFDLQQFQGAAVKIDPPSYLTVYFTQMQEQLKAYQRNLRHLAQADCQFLNTPEMICQMLHKRETNQRLKEQGIAVTEMFCEQIETVSQLEEMLREKHCYSVFIKPECFSGAAGVAAFRMHPLSGKRKLYTSCRFENGQLVNTKKLVCVENKIEICALLDQLLSLGCVVERWHPKADYHGKSYDLRVVFQFGHIAAIVARQSNGPITNLHLNNQALDVKELDLNESVMEQIALVCKRSYEVCTAYQSEGTAFGVSSMTGIDLLLEKGTMRPRVIEINGQGDLIYQDIYRENRIYQEQVRFLAGSSVS